MIERINEQGLLYLNIFNTILLILILKAVYKKQINRYFKKLERRTGKILRILLFRLSKLVLRDKKLILFGAANGSLFCDNSKYLFYIAQKDPAIKAYWITKNKELAKKLQTSGFNCEHAFSLKGLYLQLRAKVVVVSHSPFHDLVPQLTGGAIVINLWHGVGLKKVSYANKKSSNYRRYYHKVGYKRMIQRFFKRMLTFKDYYVISTSETVTSYYPETFLLKKDKILEIGQARNDVFWGIFQEYEEIPQYIKDRKVITYMPTHRHDGKEEKDINNVLNLKEIDEVCKQYNYLFLIKKHFYSKDEDISSFTNIVNIGGSEIDPQVLLKYSDVLVTDYSSCYTDYLLLDRPILFYCYDYEKYITKDRQMYHDYDKVTPGPKCKTFDDFLSSLKDILKEKDDYKLERKRVLDIFYSKENQGETARKQWNYIKRNIMKV